MSAGVFAVWLSGAVLVAPVATYFGRDWWWTLAIAFLGLASGSAIGVAVGRVIPGRVVAPIAGVFTYVVLGYTSYDNNRGATWLTPSMGYAGDGGLYLPISFHALQALWLAALTGTVLVLVSAQQKLWALVPAVMALAAAIPIASGSGYDRWISDPNARELICTEEGPEVCTTRVNSFLLDDLAQPVQEALGRWQGVPGGFSRVIDSAWRGEGVSVPPVPDGTALLYLHDVITPTGGLKAEREDGGSITDDIAYAGVSAQDCALPYYDSESVYRSDLVAQQ